MEVFTVTTKDASYGLLPLVFFVLEIDRLLEKTPKLGALKSGIVYGRKSFFPVYFLNRNPNSLQVIIHGIAYEKNAIPI